MPGYKLLVVEDEELLRGVIVDCLEGVAEIIKTAVNGQNALEMLEKESFDAILSDIGMPVMDGLTFLYNVRSRGIETPFVFLTAYGERETIREALKLGANNFIEKPFTAESICEAMEEALQLSASLKEFDTLFDKCANEGVSTSEELKRMKEIRKSVVVTKARDFMAKKAR